MHNYGYTIVMRFFSICGISSLIIASCSTPVNVENSTADTTCEVGTECQISGVLTSTNSIYGSVFVLENTSLSGMDLCVANANVDENELLRKLDKKVTLFGELMSRNESEACIYVEYGKSNIPCGYCPGNTVFVAKAPIENR